MPGSNRRPPRCKRGALPAELTPRTGSQCRGSSGDRPARRPRSWSARRPALNVCGSASRLRPPCSSRRIRASSASSSGVGRRLLLGERALAGGERRLLLGQRVAAGRQLGVRPRERLLRLAQLGQLRLERRELVGGRGRRLGSGACVESTLSSSRASSAASRAASSARGRRARRRARRARRALAVSSSAQRLELGFPLCRARSRARSSCVAARPAPSPRPRASAPAAASSFAAPAAGPELVLNQHLLPPRPREPPAPARARRAPARARRAPPCGRRRRASLLRLGEPQPHRLEPRAALLGRVELQLALLDARQRVPSSRSRC